MRVCKAGGVFPAASRGAYTSRVPWTEPRPTAAVAQLAAQTVARSRHCQMHSGEERRRTPRATLPRRRWTTRVRAPGLRSAAARERKAARCGCPAAASSDEPPLARKRASDIAHISNFYICY